MINWSDDSAADKKLLSGLNALFIAAPREISDARLLSLIKKYLPSHDIVIGCAVEKYIKKFEGQPQFQTLQITPSHRIISKVNKSDLPHKITILKYSQDDIADIYNQVDFKRVVLINGSWHRSFHLRPEYVILAGRNIPFKYVSPFVDENEAMEYANNFIEPDFGYVDKLLTEPQMIDLANETAKSSFDTSFQVGASIGLKHNDKYELIDTAFNKVVPYSTYAWHFGALREKYQSQPGDTGHYDTVHAEIMLILQAQKVCHRTEGSTIFMNLLPCPHCARALCEFDFDELVYVHDHSNGYAKELLEKAGKNVRQIKPSENV